MDKKMLMQAIKDLRQHMGMNQTDFAQQCFGKKIATQQRYEGVKPPPAKILASLVRIARKHGREDLAEIFKAGAVETVPLEIIELIREPAVKRKRA